MTKHEELIQQIKELIRNNRTGKALELLAKEQLTALDKDLIILNSQYSKVKEDQRLGVIDDDTAQRKLNKINLHLLDLSEKISAEPSRAVNYPSNVGREKKFNTWWVVAPLLLILIAIAVFAFLPKTPSGDTEEITNKPETEKPEDESPKFEASDVKVPKPEETKFDKPKVEETKIIKTLRSWNYGAATAWKEDAAYFFYNNQYLRYDVKTARVNSKYPMQIGGNFTGNWPPDWQTVDAAVKIDADNVYFFKGSQYIRYEPKKGLIIGRPKAILGNFSKNWPRGWSSVDAAVNLGKGIIYFFRGREYVRYVIKDGKIDKISPSQISGNFAKSWPSWNKVDAAVNYGNGNVYFFLADSYIRYDIKAATINSPNKVIHNFVKAGQD